MWTNETSIDVEADHSRLWAVFLDVAGWKRWNAGIARIELRGPFEDGTEFLMQLPGMEPFTSLLVNVRPGESFTDVTELDGTTVRVHHRLLPLDGGRTRVTYCAEVTGPAAAEVGPMVTEDFGNVLRSLKRLAEEGSDAVEAAR